MLTWLDRGREEIRYENVPNSKGHRFPSRSNSPSYLHGGGGINFDRCITTSIPQVIMPTTCSALEHLPTGSGGNVTVYLLRYDLSSSELVSATMSDSSF